MKVLIKFKHLNHLIFATHRAVQAQKRDCLKIENLVITTTAKMACTLFHTSNNPPLDMVVFGKMRKALSKNFLLMIPACPVPLIMKRI